MIVGKSSEDKIKSLREEMEKKKAAGVVISALDEVAWLFNLRGSDIDFNPGKFLARHITLGVILWLGLIRLYRTSI